MSDKVGTEETHFFFAEKEETKMEDGEEKENENPRCWWLPNGSDKHLQCKKIRKVILSRTEPSLFQENLPLDIR